MLHTTYANKFLELITAKKNSISGTGKCYIGFSSTTPTAAGSNFTEPSGGGYKRIQLAIASALDYTDKMGEPSGGVISNKSAFSSEQCTAEGGWPEFTHFGIFDGNDSKSFLIASDVLRDPDGTPDSDGLFPQTTMKVAHKQVAVFKVDSLQLTLK